MASSLAFVYLFACLFVCLLVLLVSWLVDCLTHGWMDGRMGMDRIGMDGIGMDGWIRWGIRVYIIIIIIIGGEERRVGGVEFICYIFFDIYSPVLFFWGFFFCLVVKSFLTALFSVHVGFGEGIMREGKSGE